MDFATIHELSRELNIPERVVRYRLLNLIAEGKLKEHDDFRRDEFKDDFHFVWRIHPLRFMTEAGLKSAGTLPTVNNVASKPQPVVNQVVNTPPPVASDPPKPAINSGSNVDTKPAEPSLSREMIDILKEQIRVKDGQLSDVGEQLKETHELNVKLTGTMLQQAQEIKNLLRLTGGKTEMVTKESESVTNVVNEDSGPGSNLANESPATGYQTGSEELRQAA